MNLRTDVIRFKLGSRVDLLLFGVRDMTIREVSLIEDVEPLPANTSFITLLVVSEVDPAVQTEYIDPAAPIEFRSPGYPLLQLRGVVTQCQAGAQVTEELFVDEKWLATFTAFKKHGAQYVGRDNLVFLHILGRVIK